jgi:hypothetical protein
MLAAGYRAASASAGANRNAAADRALRTRSASKRPGAGLRVVRLAAKALQDGPIMRKILHLVSQFLIVAALPALVLSGADAAADKKHSAPRSKPAETTGHAGAEPAPARGRAAFTVEDQRAAVVLDRSDARFFADSEHGFAAAAGHAKGAWLVLSGGGQDGAFGAGILGGWSASGNRPEFDVVTGVSAGALMAPFAFLGSRFDERLAQDSTSMSSADVFEMGGARDALFSTWPLRKLLEKRITPGLLRAVAAEHGRGRRLLVVTTNLDAGRPMVWNMGAIATRGDEPALKLFRDVLLASSSIPGLFPPVPITAQANGRTIQELHADGAITLPFFVAPPSVLAGSTGTKLPAGSVYLIINTRLAPDFAMPEHDTAAVLGRSIEIALGAALRAQLAQLQTAAARQGVDLHVASVKDDFTRRSANGTFDRAYMQALFDYGAARGRDGTGFETQASTGGWQALMRKLIGPAVAR